MNADHAAAWGRPSTQREIASGPVTIQTISISSYESSDSRTERTRATRARIRVAIATFLHAGIAAVDEKAATSAASLALPRLQPDAAVRAGPQVVVRVVR